MSTLELLKLGLLLGVPALLALILYWRGFRAGEKSQEDLHRRAKDQLDLQIREAEKKNADLDAARDQEVQEMRSRISDESLLKQWREQGWGK